ncbi:Lrp/AsnC family transcriptional regulator [Paeniglutamicibacter sp. MACA_103]|uniref:Lrp/AsnC family transcriptional regulator n=1 Tax=Paeniglutamicibacter sp. MACA_103 TaxID=3377337 RepID=UPI0038961869
MSLDVTEEDLRLIHALQIAPRISWSDAARILDSHATTLAARWQRLRTAGLSWVTANVISTSMESTLSFFDVECTVAERASTIETLCARPEVVSVLESARNRDLMLIVETANLAELGNRVVPMLTAIPGVTKFEASICTRLHSEGHIWRLDALNRKQRAELEALVVPPSGKPYSLTPADAGLVRFLMRDGRATATDIARELDLHPTTVSRRLNRILASGTLSFRCELAQQDSAFPVSCQWFAVVPPGQHEQVAEVLKSFKNLRLCASTTGTTNFTFVIWLRSVAEVMEVELAIAERVPEIRFAESAVALAYPKRVGWLLDENGRATRGVVA